MDAWQLLQTGLPRFPWRDHALDRELRLCASAGVQTTGCLLGGCVH